MLRRSLIWLVTSEDYLVLVIKFVAELHYKKKVGGGAIHL